MPKLKNIARKLKPVTVIEARVHRKVFRDFAEKIGFVYFGFVDQRDDEHRVIRGLTLSPSHRDDHYSIGTYHGYDIAMCERIDTIKEPGFPSEPKKWLIMTADLHRKHELPHIYVGKATDSQGFYRYVMTKFPHIQKMTPGAVTPYSLKFRENFTIYTTPTHFVLVEQLFGSQLESMLAEHFAGFSFEIFESTLYVYSEQQKATTELLSRMLQCAAWLASELDKR